MRFLAFLRNWSLMVKMPVSVIGIAILLAATLLVPVIHQIASTEIENLETRVQAFLAACSDGIQPALQRRDYWYAFDFLLRQRDSQSDLRIKHVLVTDRAERVFASTKPRQFRILSAAGAHPDERDAARPSLWESFWAAELSVGSSVVLDGQPLGHISAVVDLTPLRSRIADIVTTATLFTAGITFVCAVIGVLISREMILPLKRLKLHVDQVAHGQIQFIDEALIHPNDELNQLMIQFNHMAAALLEKERLADQLAIRNQLAALGKLAAGMAHEINNPLGGMLNVVNTIRRHGDDGMVREGSLALLERGMKQIQAIVQAALVTYRHDEGHLHLRPVDIEDIRLLIQSYVRSSNIDLHWHNDLVGDTDLPATSVRQLCLNLLLNACEAMPDGGELHFEVRPEADRLVIIVSDTGAGIPCELVERLAYDEEPAFGAFENSPGLGLWICTVLIRQMQGHWQIEGHDGEGTRVEITLPLHGEAEHAA